MAQDLEQNKKNALAMYDLTFNQCKPREAIEKYMGEVYIQHNPTVEDGKDGFIEHFERDITRFPGKTVHFKRVFAEGDFVIVHCHHQRPNEHEWAGIDIFRFDEKGKIVEHWDVLPLVPDKMVHSNTMF